jgi:hypothetical protein
LGYCTVRSDGIIETLLGNIPPPSAGEETDLSSVLKMEAVGFFETSVNIYRTTTRVILETALLIPDILSIGIETIIIFWEFSRP